MQVIESVWVMGDYVDLTGYMMRSLAEEAHPKNVRGTLARIQRLGELQPRLDRAFSEAAAYVSVAQQDAEARTAARQSLDVAAAQLGKQYAGFLVSAANLQHYMNAVQREADRHCAEIDMRYARNEPVDAAVEWLAFNARLRHTLKNIEYTVNGNIETLRELEKML